MAEPLTSYGAAEVVIDEAARELPLAEEPTSFVKLLEYLAGHDGLDDC